MASVAFELEFVGSLHPHFDSSEYIDENIYWFDSWRLQATPQALFLEHTGLLLTAASSILGFQTHLLFSNKDTRGISMGPKCLVISGLGRLL